MALALCSLPGAAFAQERNYFATSTPSSVTVCDINGDGLVDAQDASILKLYWKGFPVRGADCNQDGFINARDLAIVMGGWSGAEPDPEPRAIASTVAESGSVAGFRLAVPTTLDPRVGGRFTVLLLVSGSGTGLGAGEASVVFDGGRLAVRSVRTSPSVWTVWGERPKPPYGSSLTFAGGRPHGFAGSNGIVAEIDFEILAPGDPGLHIEDAQAFRPDSGGSPVATYEDVAPGLTYDGSAPSPDPVPLRAHVVSLVPVQAPAPDVPVWAVDLSVLADPGMTARYDVDDGVSHAVQLEDLYVLSAPAIQNRGFHVTVHSSDGINTDWQVNLAWPGANPADEWWWRFGSWVLLEAITALLLAYLIFRHR